MPERRLETGLLRKLARAALAFQTWLDGEAPSADPDGQAREAHRRLRAVSRSRPPSKPTCVYDSLGRLTQMTDAPAPADYSLRLGDTGELHVTTQTDDFIFILGAHGTLQFVTRRPPVVSEGDRPS